MNRRDDILRCPDCRGEVTGADEPCPHCGRGIAVASGPPAGLSCAACGASVRPGMVRCRACGASLEHASPQHPSARVAEAAFAEATIEDVGPLESAILATAAVAGSAAADATPDEAETAFAEDGAETGPVAAARRRLPWRRIGLALLSVAVLAAFAGGGWWLATRERRPPEFVAALRAPERRLTAVAVSVDGQYVAAADADGAVVVGRLPRPNDAPDVRVLTPGDRYPLLALAIASDGYLLAGGIEGKLFAWPDLGRGGGEARRITGFSGAITTVDRRPGTTHFAVGLHDDTLWVFGGEKPFVEASGHRGSLKHLRFSPDGKLLVTAGVDGRLIWRDAATKKVLGTSNAHGTDIGGLAFSADGRTLASGDWNGGIALLDPATRKERRRLTQPDAVSGIAFAGDRLVTAGWDGRLRIWTEGQEAPAAVIDTGEQLHGVAVVPGANLAVTVSGDGEICVWKLP